jgi:hypothetical protein
LEPRNPKARYRAAGTPSGNARWMEPLSDETQRAESHQRFLKRLDGSRPALFKVAEWLHRKGKTVTIPAIRYSPEHREFLKYVDKGDIIITNDDGSQSIVEVKHFKQTKFTCAEDFPHPSVIVSNIYTVQRNRGHISAYLILNKDMTHMIIVKGSKIDEWEIRDIYASNTQKFEKYYTCHPKDCKFISIEEQK